VLHEESHQSKRVQAALLPHEQPEMGAVRQLGAAGNQAASLAERDLLVRIVEEPDVEICRREDLRRVRPKASDDGGHGRDSAYSDGRIPVRRCGAAQPKWRKAVDS
jgi:hypothetical protein